MPRIRLNANRITLLLALAAVGLAAASLSVNLLGFYTQRTDIPCDHILDVAQEGNLPTYYSVLLLATAALLLFLVGSACGAETPARGRPWKALSLIFLYLSADEAAQFHEVARRLDRSLLPDWGILYWPWVVFGTAAVVILALAFARFLIDLPTDTRWRVLMAGALYVGGALGLEFTGASIMHSGKDGPALAVEETVEELLEMLGVVLFIRALLLHLSRYVGALTIAVTHPSVAPAGEAPRLAASAGALQGPTDLAS